MIYPDAVVAEIAEKYQLDAGRLAKALELVVFEYDDAGHWYTRHPHWIEAAALAKTCLSKLRALRRDWNYASEGAKQTIAAEFEAYSVDVMLAQIDNLVSIMDTLERYGGRGRGNPGRARKSPGVNLKVLDGCTAILNTFWLAERGRPLGHYVVYRVDQVAKDNRTIAEPRSQGIKFLFDCFKHLDDQITVATCRSSLQKAKAKTSRKKADQK
jgi:hypothetical protein